jgi:hypothetical protein
MRFSGGKAMSTIKRLVKKRISKEKSAAAEGRGLEFRRR